MLIQKKKKGKVGDDDSGLFLALPREKCHLSSSFFLSFLGISFALLSSEFLKN